MSKPGRNAPCPCGSGRKYKHCCVAGVEEATFTSADRHALRRTLTARLDGPLAEVTEQLERSFELFPCDPDEEDPIRVDAHAISRSLFLSWVLFDHALSDGSTLVDIFTDAEPLTPGARAYLDGMRRSSVRFYEVVSVRPDASVTFRDLVVGGDVTVRDPRLSHRLERGRLLLGRLAPTGPLGLPELDDGMTGVPPEWRDHLVGVLRDDLAKFLAQSPDASVDAFFKSRLPALHAMWRRTLAAALANLTDEPDSPGLGHSP